MPKPRLSKNLLQMKFMQRSRVEEDDQGGDVVKKRKLSVVSTRRAKVPYQTERSYLALEDMVFGRMSFQGFNAEVERWMAHYSALREEEKSRSEREMKKDVSDQEAAWRLSSVAKTIGRKFTTKRRRPETDLNEDEGKDSETTQHKKPSRHFRFPE